MPSRSLVTEGDGGVKIVENFLVHMFAKARKAENFAQFRLAARFEIAWFLREIGELVFESINVQEADEA